MRKVILRAFIFIAIMTFSFFATANLVNVSLVSDADVQVYGPLDNYPTPPLDDAAWGTAVNAVILTPNPAWTANIPGANWISNSFTVSDPYIDSWRRFHAELRIPCVAYAITHGFVDVSSDNDEDFYFNGQWAGGDGGAGFGVDPGSTGCTYNPSTCFRQRFKHVLTYPLNNIQTGINSIDFIVRNWAGSGPNPTSLIFKVWGVSYEVPDVVWQPPITNDEFELKDGTTLPIKFKLYLQDETLITDMKNVYVIVYEGDCGTVGSDLETWNLGDGVENLRFDPFEFYYIGNFKTKNYPLDPLKTYQAVVHDGCTGEILGCISFLVNAGKGNRKN